MKARLIVGNQTGKPGDIVDIPVYLIPIGDCIINDDTQINTSLEFNATIIYPQSLDKGIVLNGFRTVEYEFEY
jgi:hypothetical protein